MSLGSPSGDFADVHIGAEQIGNPGLWNAHTNGYRPWYWPVVPKATKDFEQCVVDVTDNFNSPILEFLGMENLVHWLPQRAWEFLSGKQEIEKVTFKAFVESAQGGISVKDKLIPAQIARVAAARIGTLLNSIILPEQNLLVDAPHLVSRFPSLIQEGREDIKIWNSLCNPTDHGIEDLLSDTLKKHKFKKPHWLWRPTWYWPNINRDEQIEEVRDPWMTKEVGWVFCENISRFAPSEFTQDFMALVSPHLSSASYSEATHRTGNVISARSNLEAQMTRLVSNTFRKPRLAFSVSMPIKCAKKAVRADISDILSGFLSEYSHMQGHLAKIRDGIYAKYFQLKSLDAHGLNSMLCKYPEVEMMEKNLFLHLEPPRNKRILPLVTLQSSEDWIHFRIYALLTMLDENDDLKSLAIRFETNEEGISAAGKIGAHDFYHAQLCRSINGRVHALTPGWIPESQPSIPLDAEDHISLGCVDILVMMLVCQMLSCQQNSGTGFSISCVAAPACMSLRKKIASDLSRPFCGLTAPAPNGGCFRPNTGIGTVSINDSPVGLTKASGNRCFNISPATRTWNT